MKRATFLLLALVACAKQRRINIHPERFNAPGVEFMRFVSSDVERFTGEDGRPCARVNERPKDNLVGWQSGSDDPACIHDTIDEGLRPGRLQFQWRSEIPQDGNYDLVTLGYAAGAWGRVVSRGSHYVDAVTSAQLIVEARAPHCKASWSVQLAKAAVIGPWSRAAEFAGWVAIPDLVIPSCKAHEIVAVTLWLEGGANRGAVYVDWFGFSAISDEDVNHVFGLRLRPNTCPCGGAWPQCAQCTCENLHQCGNWPECRDCLRRGPCDPPCCADACWQNMCQRYCWGR